MINIPDYTLSGLGGQPALNGTGLVRMDGTSVSYDNNTYLTSSDETDPEVGVNTTNYLPKWNGTALVTSSIYDNGNVGIGTTNPLAKLSFGDFHFPGAIPPPAEQTVTLRLYDGGDGTVIYGFGVSTNSLNIAANQAGGRIRFWTDGTERSIVNESGLNVVGTLTLNGVPVCTSSDSYWSWNPNGGGNTYLTAGQNVGIGTSSPLHKLDVVGYINTDVNFGYKMGGLTVLKAYQSNGSTVVGHYAGLNLQTDGLYNVAVGNGALQTATTGGSNTAVGNGSLYSSNSYSNSAFGSWSLYYTTSGSHNTAFGSYALYKNLIGNYNSAFGNESLNQTTGNSNVGIGHYSLLFNSSGSNNTVIGVASGRGQFGSVIQNSVLVGYAAGLNLTTGSNNLLLGYQAGDDITSGGNNIVIGYDISTPSPTTSNHLNIGNLIFGDLSAGKVGIGTATPGQKLTVAGTIESTSGGFKFPDGTVQASAATGGGGGHYVGELYGGGVVFWVDHNGDHGLICSMIDLSTSQAWSNVASTLIGPTAQSDWDGQSNTNAIIGQSGHTGSAAKLCDDYTNVDYGTGAYSDWYLPTIDDLNLLYNAKRFVSKALDSDLNGATTAITKNVYWSSTEDGDALAMSFLFVLFIGVGGGDDKANTFSVRAIRAF